MTTTREHNAKVNNGDRRRMDLMQLIDQFGSEDLCRTYLEHLRWPGGVRCVNCGSDSISRITTRNQLDCNACRTRFSVTSGTVFHDSHLPLRKWFLAVYMIGEARKGVSANQLKRTLNVAYKTAWYLCHRIRWAMGLTDRPPLSGTVEADETYVGGKKRFGKGVNPQEKALHRMDNKSVVLGAIERGGDLRVQIVPDAKGPTVRSFLRDALDADTENLYTDAHRSYRRALIGMDTRHEYVDHAADEWVRGDVHTNSIESAWSLFDRAVIGSYHKLSKKHLPAYLSEFEFRFNNRENPYLFRDTLLALIKGERLTYADLTEQADRP